MSYKTILVCLANEANAERLTQAACTLARRFDAHLIGLHTLRTLETYVGTMARVPHTTTLAFNEEETGRAENIRETFEKLTKTEDFVSEWRLESVKSRRVGETLVEHAHCADLVVMGQADPEHNPGDQNEALQDVIRQSGRPVLVFPYIGEYQTFGQHALMGWSATREASRAIYDAIPLVGDNGEATILWVSNSDKDSGYLESTAHAVAACLGRHGVDTTVAHWQNSEIAIGDALLNEAFHRGADLIVTGAFGHSRFYDFVIGATTTHLLNHMTLPVLFSN